LVEYSYRSQINYAEKISESAEALFVLERKAGAAAIVRDRMRFLRLLKSGVALIPPAAGAVVSYRKAWSYQLWNRYVAKGVSALSDYPFKGTKPRLDNEEQQQQFTTSLAKDNIATLADAVTLLRESKPV
jgi:hypothetical protein